MFRKARNLREAIPVSQFRILRVKAGERENVAVLFGNVAGRIKIFFISFDVDELSIDAFNRNTWNEREITKIILRVILFEIWSSQVFRKLRIV